MRIYHTTDVFRIQSNIYDRAFTAQKMKFSVKDLFSKCDHLQFPADFGKFTEEILNGKLLFLCSVCRKE